jgi:hypothetical protein
MVYAQAALTVPGSHAPIETLCADFMFPPIKGVEPISRGSLTGSTLLF